METKVYGSITITKVNQLYTWIKFAKDKDGSFMTDNPVGQSYMGIAYNQESEIKSDDPSDYTWSRIKDVDCRIESSEGTAFEEKEEGTTTLTARIYDSATEIDGDGRFTYNWYFKDEDALFKQGKTITVNIQDVLGKGIYFIADDGDIIPDYGYAEGVDF